METTTHPHPVHAWIRRGAFYWLFFAILSAEATFLLVMAGLDFEPVPMVLVMCAFSPMVFTAWRLWVERDRMQTHRLEPWPLWAILSLVLFGFWAGGYFLVGLLTDPTRVRLFPAMLDRFIPLSPPFVFLYVTVYPIFLLPFFYARDRAVLLRTVLGYVVMLLISYGIFLAIPIAFDRPILPPSPPDCAYWTLALVYGGDPPWNCLPSTHCGVALLAALALWETDRRMGLWAILTALAIGVSTLYTKQHYLVDALAGFLLAFVTWWMLRWIWRRQVS